MDKSIKNSTDQSTINKNRNENGMALPPTRLRVNQSNCNIETSFSSFSNGSEKYSEKRFCQLAPEKINGKEKLN